MEGEGILPPPTSGMTLWLKADLYTGTGTWTDTVNSYAFVGPGGAGNPTSGTSINSKASVDFVSASSQNFSGSTNSIIMSELIGSGTTWSIFCVFNYTGSFASGATFGGACIIGDGSANINFGAGEATSQITAVGYNGSSSVQVGSLSLGPHVSAWVQSGNTAGDSSVSIDGGVAVTGDGHTVGGLTNSAIIGKTVGPIHYWDGSMGDIICYNVALSGSDTTTVVNYLGNKYGITV